MQRIRTLIASTLVLALLSLVGVLGANDSNAAVRSLQRNQKIKTPSSAPRSAPIGRSASEVTATVVVSLPDALRDFFSAHDAVGTVTLRTPSVRSSGEIVVVLLQRHQSPGTDADNAVNDVAAITQRELAAIMRDLVETYGISNVLVEGQQVGATHVARTERALADVRREAAQLTALDATVRVMSASPAVPSALRAALTTSADAFRADADRALLLRGAAFSAYAQGTELAVMGAETPATYEQSAAIVVDYMHLTARLAELASPAKRARQRITRDNSSSGIAALRGMMDAAFHAPASSREAVPQLPDVLQRIAAQTTDPQIREHVRRAQDMLAQYARRPANERAASADTRRPSLARNPYARSSDARALTQRLDRVEVAMERTVVAQRNADAATNFHAMLDAADATVGMLQFGAGHEEGLVAELLARGMIVLAVTPKSIAE
ncbi:MAG: hypothetical protein Q7T01_04420 [bacterium]|nr:hypothetical protein [bacterium]